MSRAKGQLFIVSGPSGSGKSSLCHIALRDLPGVRFSISYTTRKPRQNEREGEDYFFITQETFGELRQNGEFLESACVYGNYYATGRRMVLDSLALGWDVLLDIDVQGATQVKRNLPESVATLVFPPDYETLRKRLQNRGLDREEVIRERLVSARSELMRYRAYDYVIVNDNLEEAARQLMAIIAAGRCRMTGEMERLERILTTFE